MQGVSDKGLCHQRAPLLKSFSIEWLGVQWTMGWDGVSQRGGYEVTRVVCWHGNGMEMAWKWHGNGMAMAW